MNNELLFQSIKVEHLANQLSESSLGLHSLIIYPDLTTLSVFYSYYIQKQIKEKNELVFVSPFYETTDSIRHNLSNGYKTIDVDKYERQEKKLLIMDSLDKYLGQKDKDKGKEKGKRTLFSYFFHLMLHPPLGYCFSGTGLPSRIASSAVRRSLPVNGFVFLGLESSRRPL